MPPLLSSQMKLGAPDGTADAPAPGIGAELASRAQIYVDEDPDGVTYRRYKGYEPLIEALRDKGVGDAAMQSRADVWGIGVPGTESWDYRKVYDLARQHGVGDLKKDRSEFEAGVAARPGYQQRRAQAERGGRWWLELPLGVVQSFQPEYGPLPALGLPSKTILGAAAREAAINVLFEGVEIARTKEARDTLGNPITVGEGAARLGMAAGAGALFGGGVRAVPVGIDAARGRFETIIANNWDKLPAGLREKWGSAANVDGTALPDVFEAIVGRDNMSLDEKGAVALLRREAEIDAANPFRPDGAGVETHNAAVARNVERIAAEIQGMRAPRTAAASTRDGPVVGAGQTIAVPGRPGQVGYANDVYQFFRAKGLTDSQARGIAAGIHAESASNHNVRGGYKGRAVGLGQWLGDRRAKLLARYGDTPTRQQQLDFMWEELQGGDAGGRAVLSATDERAVLDAYIRKFMRPAPGAQTTGDLTRGMQALGRGGETMEIVDGPAGRAADDGIDPEAAIAADLRARGAAIDAERADLDADLAARGGEEPDPIEATRFWDDSQQRFVDALNVAPLPELRRDLFPDAVSWRTAQAGFEADMLGLPAPVVTRRAAWIEARQELRLAGEGEIPGGLFHSDVGPIDIKWGEAPSKGKPGFGLAKMEAKHPEVLDDLPEIIDGLTVASRSENRIVLESPDHKAIVRLEWDGKEQAWLLSAYERKGKAPPRRTTDVPGKGAQDGSPARGATDDIAENAPAGNAAAKAGAAEPLPMERMWGDPTAPRDAGGLTAAERASLDYNEPGLKDFVDPAGEGNRLDLDGSVHDLRAAIDAEDPLAGVAFATREGIDETPADALAAIDAEEKALAALRSCL